MSFTIPWHLGHLHSSSHEEAKHRRAEAKPLLERNERILYRVVSASGTSVATDRALLYSDRPSAWRRISWSDIAAVDRSRIVGRLALRLWPDEPNARPRLDVVADTRLAAVVRERIEAHRLLCVPIDLDGNRGHVIALRDGAGVRWRVTLEKPTDNPATRRACADLIAEIRGIAGI
jgi:hypothetical protein